MNSQLPPTDNTASANDTANIINTKQKIGEAPKVLIADDEALLIQALEKELKIAWPELNIADKVGNGATAIEKLMQGQHDIAFLDIKMPVKSGIDVAHAITEEWPDADDTNSGKAPPLFVFVTAYDEFAIEAFELAAIDYIVKPVTAKRLGKTVERLKTKLASQASDTALDQLVEQVSEYEAKHNESDANVEFIKSVKAGVGDTIYLIQTDEIILFEASEKYVIIHTADHQALIREPLKSLLPQLDPKQFQQIHRSTIVNVDYVVAAIKGTGSKMNLKMKDCDVSPVVSRLYKHLFKAQ